MSKHQNINWFERPIVGTYTWWESGERAVGYRGQGQSQVLVVGETDKMWWFAYSKDKLRAGMLHSARKAIPGSRGNYCRLQFDLNAIKYAEDAERERQAIQNKIARENRLKEQKRKAVQELEAELERYANDTNPEIAQMARDALASKDYQSFYDKMNSL